MIDSLPLTQGQLGQPLVDQYWHDGYPFPLPAMPEAAAHGYRRTFETLEAMALYDQIRVAQSAVMMKDAKGKNEMYA